MFEDFVLFSDFKKYQDSTTENSLKTLGEANCFGPEKIIILFWCRPGFPIIQTLTIRTCSIDPKITNIPAFPNVILCFVIDIGIILVNIHFCFLLDICLTSMLLRISSNGSSSFFGAHLSQIRHFFEVHICKQNIC